MPTLKELLESTREFIAVKEAEYKSTVEGVEKEADKALNTAGAGDDSEITRGHALEADEAALEPKKEPAVTADANAEPNNTSGKTTGSAEGKDEGNVTDRSDKLEADDAALEPKKEPEISSDANAEPNNTSGKTAEDAPAKLANEILNDIRTAKEAAVAEESAEGKADEAKAEDSKEAEAEDTEESKEAAEKCEKCGEAECKCEDDKAEDKQAAGPQLELTTDVLAKLAAMVLSTEEGAEFVEGELAKHAGAEAANETLAFLAEQSELAEKQAAYEQGQADAQALIDQAIFEQGKEAAFIEMGETKEAEDYAAGQADAEALLANLVEMAESGDAEKQAEAADMFEKLGQAVADASIADLMDQAGEGEAEMDMGADELAAGAEGVEGAEEAMGEEEEGITEEELQMALQSLVEDGTITEDEAAQVLDYVSSAEEGEEGMEAAEGAEEMPAEEAGMETEASDTAGALLEQIKQIRASRG